jgi:hypothetical protein
MGLKKGGSMGPEGPTYLHSSSAEEDEDKTKLKEKRSDKDSSSATDGTITAEEQLCVSSKSSTDLHG